MSFILTVFAESQGNGEASKSELRAARAKNRKSAWALGNIRNPAKKRKADACDDSMPASNASSNENAADVKTEDAKTEDCVTDGPSAITLAGETTQEESQASDAVDSQTEMDIATSTVPTVTGEKKVLVDQESLDKLLSLVVDKTDGWSLERLLRLYSKLSKMIDRYKKLWDRRPLVEVICGFITNVTSL